MKSDVKPSTRLLSALFDIVVCLAFSLFIMLWAIISFINAMIDKSPANISAMFIACFSSGALVILFALIYMVVLPAFWKGQTLGKRFFRIKLVRADGNNVDLKTLLVREITRLVLLVISLGASAIGDIFALCLSKSHRSFCDVISSTYVINVNEETQGGIDYGNTTH